MNHSEELTDKFGVDCDYLDQLVPKGEYLGADHVYVVDQLVRQFVGIQRTWATHSEGNQGVRPGSEKLLPCLHIFVVLRFWNTSLSVVLAHHLINLAIIVVYFNIKLILAKWIFSSLLLLLE